MVHLLELPDEVKLKIFKYLDGVDKLELLKVCEDLRRIGVDREVIQSLNFSKNYKFNLSHLRFVGRQSTCELVTVLNLNGVYWITSAQLRNTLIKFKNLAALYIVDTQLNFRELATVLNSTKKIKKLALSQKPENLGDVFKRLETKITHLFITYNSHAIRNLMALISKFTSLEELWIIETSIPNPLTNRVEVPWSFYVVKYFPKVSKKIVLGRQSSYVPEKIQFIKALKSYDGNWMKSFDFDDHTIFIVEENVDAAETQPGWTWAQLGNFRSVPHFHKRTSPNRPDFDKCIEEMQTRLDMWNIFAVNEQRNIIIKGLEYAAVNYKSMNLIRAKDAVTFDELDLNLTVDLFKIFLFLPNLKTLQRLRTDSLPFWEKKKGQGNGEVGMIPLFKRRRIGVGSNANENDLFERFTLNTPEMRDFELVDLSELPLRYEIWQPESLKFIQNWTMLKRLCLTSVNIKNNKFLIDVTKHCTMLEVLKIRDDTMQDRSSNLCEALRYAANLRDLRYERKAGIPMDSLFESATHCKRLERLYLQCRFTNKISKKPLETFITQCENLVFLFIFISELPEAVCKSIKQSLNEFGNKPNQVICIRGQSYTLRNVSHEDISSNHIHDMVCQSTDLYFDVLQDF